MELTKDIAYKELRKFFDSQSPSTMIIFGTGTSCAIDWRFGMSKLKEELEEKVPIAIRGVTGLEKEWSNVVNDLNRGFDLENSMNHAKSDKLIKSIVEISGRLVSDLDKEFAYKILNREIDWLPTKLLKRLVDGLSDNDRSLKVVTPNYDMLAEYAFEVADIPFINGFYGSLQRKLDWDLSKRTIKLSHELELNGKKKSHDWKTVKHIELYKVHGSINTFEINNNIVENNLWAWNPPENMKRVMITPGISKFEKLAQYRDELFKPFDEINKKTGSYIFIGYGFNDSHIENYIKPKLTDKKCPGLIVTMESNPRIESLLNDSDNLWLVCKEEEKAKNGTRIKNKGYNDWLYLYDKELWNIKNFTKEIIGD
jgi:hypothetical protein